MVQNIKMCDEDQHTVIRLRLDIANYNKTTYTYSHLVISVTIVCHSHHFQKMNKICVPDNINILAQTFTYYMKYTLEKHPAYVPNRR